MKRGVAAALRARDDVGAAARLQARAPARAAAGRQLAGRQRLAVALGLVQRAEHCLTTREEAVALARRRWDDRLAAQLAHAGVEALGDLGHAGAGRGVEQVAVVGTSERRGEHEGEGEDAHAAGESKARATRKPEGSDGRRVRSPPLR